MGTQQLVAQMLESNHITPIDVMTLGNTEALKQAVIQGAGIATLAARPRRAIRRLGTGITEVSAQLREA